MKFKELINEGVNKSFDKNVKELVKMGYAVSEDHSGEFATTLFDKKFEVKITLHVESPEIIITVEPKNALINKVPSSERSKYTGSELTLKNFKALKEFLK
jgi:hypothetical protein|tara:strand:+ start:747 stop:1046 length:300 start_codon:yes stop_codon:yes gene_type:complete